MSGVSSSSGSGTVSNGRYWGLASGLDVDSIVTALVSDEQGKIDKVKQQQQTLQWQQSAYQTVISDLQAFQSTYLSITGSSSMLKSSTYATYNASSDNTALLSAVATAGATGGTKSVAVVQSATSAEVDGSAIHADGSVSGSISESETNPTFTVTLDGVTKTISLTPDQLTSISNASDETSKASALQGALKTQLESAFGSVPGITKNADGSVSTSASVDKLTATVTASSGNYSVTFTPAANYQSTLSVTSSAAGSTFSSSSNRLNTGESLATLLGSSLSSPTAHVKISVNGTVIDLGEADTTTVSAAFSTIKASTAGVSFSYSNATDKASVISSTSGAAGSVTFNPTADTSTPTDTDKTNLTTEFLSALGISQADIQSASDNGTSTGRDAIVNINGSTYSRSSNNFTIDGVNYTINQNVTTVLSQANPSAYTTNVTLTQDTSTLQKNVQNFVTAYNSLVTTLYSYIGTKPNSDYQPLTDAQKSEMSTDQITAWNQKAQQGILFNDSTLQSVADDLRGMLYQSVTLSDGKTVSLFNFGITTSDDPDQHGTLVIDQNGGTDFEDALANNAAEFQEFFTKTSTDSLSFTSSNADRTSQEGLISRLSDAVQLASGSSGGSYGSLLLIAGTTSSTTQYNNYIYSELQELSSQLTDLNTEMTTKKNRLYSQFTALESYMQEANTQSSYLSSMLS